MVHTHTKGEIWISEIFTLICSANKSPKITVTNQRKSIFILLTTYQFFSNEPLYSDQLPWHVHFQIYPTLVEAV